MIKKLSPPPTESPLGRRERGHGKLVCWPYRTPADRLAGVAVPYGYDARGRALWKFVLRLDGKAVVIPARDWPHANNESLKRLGKWDEIVAAKAARKEARKARITGIAASEGWRYADLTREWLAHKHQQGRARPSTLAGYADDLKRHFDPFFNVKLDNPALAEITPVAISAFRAAVTGAKGDRRREKWNKLFSRGWEIFEFARALGKIDRNPWIAPVHRYPERTRDAEQQTTVIPATQLDLILDEAEKLDDPRVSVAVLLAGYGGLRLDEMTHVRVGDLTVTDTLVDLKVTSGFPCSCSSCAKDGNKHLTKNGTTRYVPFLPEHGQRFAAHVERLRTAGVSGPETWLLACLERQRRSKAKPGNMVRRDTIAGAVEGLVARTLGLAPVVSKKKAKNKSGQIRDVTRTRYKLPKGERIHVLRHAARTRLSHLGLPSETIDLIMGHRLTGMRGTYTHQDRAAAYRLLCEKAGRNLPSPVQLVRSA